MGDEGMAVSSFAQSDFSHF